MTRKELLEKRSDLANKLDAVSTVEELNALKVDLDAVNAAIQAKDLASEIKSADAGESKEVKQKLNFGVIAKAIASGRVDGFLAEISQEGRRQAEKSRIELNGENSIVLSPQHLDVIMNATLTTATAADGGGNAIETIASGYIDKLRDRLVVAGMGADYQSGLMGNLEYFTEKTVAQAVWDAENDAISDTSATFEKRTLSPKRLAVYLPVSNKWLAQTPAVLHTYIERQLLNAAAEKIESAAIAGTGANDMPTGILSASGVTTLFAGNAALVGTNANGAALVYEDVVALEKAIAVNNADMGGLGYLTNAKVRAALKTTAVAAEDAERVWRRGENNLEGYPVGITNLVPSNLAKGGSTTLSAMIFGNFNDLIIGQWGGLEILVDPYTRGLEGITRMIINHYVDVLVRRPESFAVIKDIVA